MKDLLNGTSNARPLALGRRHGGIGGGSSGSGVNGRHVDVLVVVVVVVFLFLIERRRRSGVYYTSRMIGVSTITIMRGGVDAAVSLADEDVVVVTCQRWSRLQRPLPVVFPALDQGSCHVEEVDGDAWGEALDDDFAVDERVEGGVDGCSDGVVGGENGRGDGDQGFVWVVEGVFFGCCCCCCRRCRGGCSLG